MGTGSCSVTCNLGVAPRTVTCVQFVHGRERAVPETECQGVVRPATTVPCLVQVCTFRWEVKQWSQVRITTKSYLEYMSCESIDLDVQLSHMR